MGSEGVGMQTIYGSHSAIAPFRLLRPARIEDAAAAERDGAVCLAGGVDLVPALRAGRRAESIVHLGGIAALKTVERRGDTLRIGAGVTYARLAADPLVAAALPDLAVVWRGVANVRVRHAATVGGNVMARNPQYDMLPALMALDAKLIFAGASGEHEAVGADADAWPRGILAFIDIPLAAERRFAMERGFKPALSLAVCVERNKARVAIGCAYERVLCRVVNRSASAEALAGALADGLPEPASDWIASGAYRRKLARVLVARQLRALMGR
jgi:aerobic carbon-monoxide dehydrogenase medium subunit